MGWLEAPGPLAVRWTRPSTFFCAFLTLLNDRLGESIVFPLLPFLLAGFTSDGRVLGLLAGRARSTLCRSVRRRSLPGDHHLGPIWPSIFLLLPTALPMKPRSFRPLKPRPGNAGCLAQLA